MTLQTKNSVHIIGSGLAGSEAALFLARAFDRLALDYSVVLHEMRPLKLTPAHHTGQAAELVCSNSFKSMDPDSAPGILKAEMRTMGSRILDAADRFAVAAGQALAVDREKFSDDISAQLLAHLRITIKNEEVDSIPDGQLTLMATGPLTSESLTEWLLKATHNEHSGQGMYFYDAIAPIVDAVSIDMSSAFYANRYDKGDEVAYLNCPLNKEEYEAFIDALIAGEKVAPKNFEKEKFFQGCQPIEAIAATGRDTLRFGPMKPVGLDDPKTGRRPWAVVQLRPENQAKTAFNLVGFQTKLKYGEQARVFKLIPALKNAEFLRMGSIHRNTYVCGPLVLNRDLSLRSHPHVHLAGQITGVEGYLESAACGLLAAHFILLKVLERLNPAQDRSFPPVQSCLGALHRFITASEPKNYQPQNSNFSIFESGDFENLPPPKQKDARKAAMAVQAKAAFKHWWKLQYEDLL